MTTHADPRLRVTILAGGGLGHVSGGVGTVVTTLLDAWGPRPDAPVATVIDTRGGGGTAAGILALAVALARLAWLCATRRTGLVHAHMTTRGSVARKVVLCTVAGWLGTPFVVHMHGADFFAFYGRLHPWARRPVRRVLGRAQRVVVLGQGWRDFLVREAGVAPARIAVVLNGVPRPPSRPPRAPGPPRILFLGRIGDRKGVPELLAALAGPLLGARAWQATIAGDGERDRFAALCRGHGLDHRVALPGWIGREATQALLAQADMLVLPSHDEALPMAVVEALAHGVPVVTTPVGAVPEFLTDGVHALLVPPGNVAALARALAAVLDGALLARGLGAAGQRVFLDHLQAERMAAQVLAIYQEAARCRPAVRPRAASPPARAQA